MSEIKIKKIWVHEGYKQVGTSNWTVREQNEKPPAPTGYNNDWVDYLEAAPVLKLLREMGKALDDITHARLVFPSLVNDSLQEKLNAFLASIEKKAGE